MKMGTKSLLFGAHQFIYHPLCVLYAWWKCYGIPFDPRIWVCAVVHDWGYWGKPDMDGEEGKRHPILGAQIAGALFGERWYFFCLYHSRSMASQDGVEISRLCVADKLSLCYVPNWLYIPMAQATGEIYEYMERADSGTKYEGNKKDRIAMEAWLYRAKGYLANWAEREHKVFGAEASKLGSNCKENA